MCVVLLYVILNNFTHIKFSDYFQLNDFLTRSHPLTILPFPSSINAFHYSFFVNSVFFWNSIPFDVLSAPLNHFSVNLSNFCFDCNVIFLCMRVCTYLVSMYVCMYIVTYSFCLFFVFCPCNCMCICMCVCVWGNT